MDLVLQLLVNGLVNGSHYALLGLSFGLIFGTTRITHFAYGPLYARSAYACWWASASATSSASRNSELRRSAVPAITHVDYSARVQTVDDRNGRYYDLIRTFERKTGCPVIINTSFNVRGEPIVGRPENAYRCFLATDMDVLVLERCVLLKEEQPALAAGEREKYLAQFELD